jgi:hypothetical protein
LKFDDLKPEDLQYLATVHKNTEIPYDQRIDILKGKFGKSERTIRRWLKKGKFSKYEAIENDQVRQGKLKGFDSSKKIKLITWSQNATPIHATMLKNMEIYAEFLNAEIFVIAGRYSNPTSIYSDKMENDEWWDTSVLKYIGSSNQTIHPQLDVLAELKIVPTAVNPLSSIQGFSHGRSCIVGHPRMHLESLPVLEGHNTKLMLTTGALTLKNYTDSKAGQLGAFNHVYGFVVVEIKNDDIHYVRQVPVSTDGTFTDLIYHVDAKVEKIDSCAAFIMGDIHVDDVENDIVKETLRYFKKVRPEKVVLHDIINGTSVNRHEVSDPIASYKKYKEGSNIIKKEVERVVDFLNKHKLTDYDLYSAASNHNDWFDRYIKDTDWRKDIANSETYMEYALALLQGKAPKGIIAYLLEKEFEGKIKCLDRDESLQVRGFELSQHGDIGANGSRGSIEGYRKLNTKIVTGHQHSIARKDGVVTVGTYTKLRLPYNKGASAWRWAGVVTHHNGKSQQVIFQKDKKCSTLF